MSSLESIIYVSVAAFPFGEEECESLLVEASLSNLESAVTGVLLYSSGCFMGYLEGEPAMLAAAYGRVRHSRHHTGLMELLERPIADRLFSDWMFAHAECPQSDLVRLSTARWKRLLGPRGNRPNTLAALGLLQQFWINANRGFS